MFNLNRRSAIVAVTAIIATSIGLSACGGAYRTDAIQKSVSPTTGKSTAPTYVNSTNATTTETFNTAMTFGDFVVTGSGGTTPNFDTRNINNGAGIITDSSLRVKITPGQAKNLSISIGNAKYSNFSAKYNCVSYTVTLIQNGSQTKSVTTKALVPSGSNGSCPASDNASSQIIDFSSSIGTGQTKVDFLVKADGYDYYCQMWNAGIDWWNPYTYYQYCPLHSVYINHTVSGTLEVETNATASSSN